MLIGSTAGDVGLYTVSGLAGVVVTGAFSQWNKRRDERKAAKETNISARVADTEAALDAWDRINGFMSRQVETLTLRVNDLEARIQAYEITVIPQMQSVIDGLRATVTEKQRTVDGQQRKIEELLARIDQLQSGGAA